jgi:orotidine-5'-phosphate decarboxylase
MLYEKYAEITKDKKSFININLDPALPKQRKDNVIPERFLSREDADTLLNFSFYVIEEVSDYCCSVKPNSQFFLGSYHILRKLAKKIHDEGMFAILDHKLSDIGSTNDSAIFWIADMEFDAFTFSPFAGNVQPTVDSAHKKDLGVIVLTLMSNPEAENIMVETLIKKQPLYLQIAEMVKESQADGCVVGLTGFVKGEYIKNIQRVVGDRVIFLMQGIGPQGGETTNIKYVTNPLVSLGRAVIFANNPREEVKTYYEMFKSIKN